jgi:hypothetical protein
MGQTKPAELGHPSETVHFFMWLINDCGYRDPRQIRPGWYAAIRRMNFTHAIVTGPIGDRTGVQDNWCYHDYPSALLALEQWGEHDYAVEPAGWHRHPRTGRRVATEEGERDHEGRIIPIGEMYVRG